MTDIEIAKEELRREGVTCAAVKDGKVVTSEKRGIAPLIEWYEDGADSADDSRGGEYGADDADHVDSADDSRGGEMQGYSVADKVVGKAPAMMYVLLGVSQVYACVMTNTAKEILTDAGIACSADTLTDTILRDDKADICPMEKAVMDIDEPEAAFDAIKEAISRMAANTNK